MGDLWRKIKPKCNADAFSMIYAQIMINAGVIYGKYAVLPWMKENSDIGTGRIVVYHMIGAYIYVNVMGRIWKMIMINTSTVGKILPTLLKPGWQYCPVCESNSPPRSFHCHICNKCILKRDHHCMFTGKCIGHYTYGYYLLLILNVWMGTLFALTMGFDFTWSNLGGISLLNCVYFVLPIFSFMFGQISFYVATTTFIYFLATVFFIATTGMMIVHSKHVIHGIVTYERRHDIYLYDLGFKENFYGVFGTNWYMFLLWFGCEPNLPGDGIEFVKRENFEREKDL